MNELDRKKTIEDFECLVDKFGENGSYNRYITVSNTLDLLKELIEENESLEDNLIKQSTENIMLLIEQQEIKANTVRRMQSDIKDACLKGGIWPAFVARVVECVGDKILEENNDN
jgi:hypothetical protein